MLTTPLHSPLHVLGPRTVFDAAGATALALGAGCSSGGGGGGGGGVSEIFGCSETVGVGAGAGAVGCIMRQVTRTPATTNMTMAAHTYDPLAPAGDFEGKSLDIDIPSSVH